MKKWDTVVKGRNLLENLGFPEGVDWLKILSERQNWNLKYNATVPLHLQMISTSLEVELSRTNSFYSSLARSANRNSTSWPIPQSSYPTTRPASKLNLRKRSNRSIGTIGKSSLERKSPGSFCPNRRGPRSPGACVRSAEMSLRQSCR